MSGTSRSNSVQVDSPTEQRNPDTKDIDQLSTVDILREINSADTTVPYAVATVLPDLAKLVDHAVDALRAGHRVHYVGAGTSGRLAVLDAAELVPTFNIPADWFLAHHAGGVPALFAAVENAEDDEAAGMVEMQREAAAGDVVIGLTASGRTPFVTPGPPATPAAPRQRSAPAAARDATSASWCLPQPDPRAAPRPTEDRRPGRRPAPTRSPGLPQGARQPSDSPRCRRASARPDGADPSALRATPTVAATVPRRSAPPPGPA
jgi:phosphoheptose isomerase